MTIKLRNKTYSLRIRVPARYRHLSRSSHVWRSLGTDSLEQARAREHDVRARLMAQWAPEDGRSGSLSPTLFFGGRAQNTNLRRLIEVTGDKRDKSRAECHVLRQRLPPGSTRPRRRCCA